LYELSLDHPILCLWTGDRRARAVCLGASVLASDPAVRYVEMYEAGRKVRVAVSNRGQGDASLEAVRAEGKVLGRAQGLQEVIVAVLTARGLSVGDDFRATLAGIKDPAVLRSLIPWAATAASVDEVLAALHG
jgi:hypothetical protein